MVEERAVHGQDLSDLWVPKLVKARLVESVRIVNATAGPVGPAGYGSSLPRELVEAASRRQGDGETPWWGHTDEGARNVVRRFSPARVSQAEIEALWPYRYLRDAPPPAGSDLEPLLALKTWLSCKLTRGVTFEEACKACRWARGTAYRAVDRALSVIAQGLNRDGVPVPS